MDYDFDTFRDRSGTSLKWGLYRRHPELLPLWVADMDFEPPAEVLEAIRRRLEQRDLGYALAPPELATAVLGMLRRHYAWTVDPSWLVWCPGIVPGLAGMLIQTPVYPRIYDAAELSGGKTRAVMLQERPGGGWGFVPEEMEAAVTPQTTTLILCNPQNPTGHVFSRDELFWLADFARRHDLVVCSDEIHADLRLDPQARHIPIAILNRDIAARTVTFMAPSKSYNIPGLGLAFAIIPDAELRSRFVAAMEHVTPPVNCLAYAAAIAAYEQGGEWLAQCLDYLRGNAALVAEAAARMSPLRLAAVPQATYLAWLDARSLPVERPVAFFREHGVVLSDGADFGAPGWLRLNFACSRTVLKEALRRMAAAVAALSRPSGKLEI